MTDTTWGSVLPSLIVEYILYTPSIKSSYTFLENATL